MQIAADDILKICRMKDFKTIQLIGIKPSEFASYLINEWRQPMEKALKEHIKQETDNKLLSREQTAEMLGISLLTLHNWTKKGKLQSYGIGSRVYYKEQEVLSNLIEL